MAVNKRGLSPLRYPGGKQFLFNFMKSTIEHHGYTDRTFVEPFAGGAALSLSLLDAKCVQRVLINDSDIRVHSFWEMAVDYTKDLIDWVSRVPITMDEREKSEEILRNPMAYPLKRVACAVLFVNRTSVSGCLKGGVIGGKDQSGPHKMDCRFNRGELMRKLQRIEAMRDGIIVKWSDFSEILKSVYEVHASKSFLYLDPPCLEKSDGLYFDTFQIGQHQRLADILNSGHIECPWLLSYDNHPVVRGMYPQRTMIAHARHKKPVVNEGNELLIFSEQLTPFARTNRSNEFLNQYTHKYTPINRLMSADYRSQIYNEPCPQEEPEPNPRRRNR